MSNPRRRTPKLLSLLGAAAGGAMTLMAWASSSAHAWVFPLHDASQTRAALLLDNPIALGIRLDSLERAHKSIQIQSYVFNGDESSLAIAELLKKRRADGLTVQVIVDAWSNVSRQAHAMYEDLTLHGVEIQGYEPTLVEMSRELDVGSVFNANKRFHQKMWIIDAGEADALAIIGGRNLASGYFGMFSDHRWWNFDADVALRGPIVSDMALAFSDNRSYFLEKKLNSSSEPDSLWNGFKKRLSKTFFPGVRAVTPDPTTMAAIDALKKTVSLDQLEFIPAQAQLITSRPRLGESDTAKAYFKLISRSRSISIVNSYFIAEGKLLEALKVALRSGAHVRIITNSLATSNYKAVALAARYSYLTLYDVLQEAGTRRKKGKLAIFEYSGPGLLHTKFAVFDARTSIIGSHNLDPRSRSHNSESIVLLGGQAIAVQFLKEFHSKYLPRSELVTLEQAQTFHDPPTLSEKIDLYEALLFRPFL